MNAVSSARQSMATVESFLDEINKTAEAHTETGSIGGATTHPVRNVDDRTEAAREGARSAENTKDVKEDQGKPSVDSTAVAAAKKADAWVQTGNSGDGGTASADQIQIGTKKGPTGTDVPAAKAGKNDPGSSHPARTDNNALNGGKYAAADLNNDPLEKLAGEMAYLGNVLCADITVLAENEKAATTPAATGKQANIDPALARQAGWEMASLVSGNMDKQAADTMVHQTLAATIKEAEDAAERAAVFLNNFYAAKQAGDGDAGAPPSGPGGGMPPGGGGMPGGPPPSDPSDPSGGGDDPEAELAQLQQICAQLGTTIPELLQTLESSAGGGGGGASGAGGPPPGGPPPGADPSAGGPPPGADPSAGGPPAPGGPPGMQVTAGDAFENDKMANYIKEVVSRSRTKAAATRK